MFSNKEKELIGEYRDYYGEGWSLVDCKAMTWPFYKVEVCYAYTEEEALPIVEEFVLKAIDTGYIQDVRSLGSFLGLEQAIIDNILAELHQKDIVALAPCLQLMEKGKLLLQQLYKIVLKDERQKVYIDGVSGKCRFEDVKRSKNRDAAIKAAIVYPRAETLEAHYRNIHNLLTTNFNKINQDEAKNTKVLKDILNIQEKTNRLYEDRLVLFYKEDVGSEGKFLILTDGAIDEDATVSLENAFEEGKSGFDIKEQGLNKVETATQDYSNAITGRKITYISDIDRLEDITVIEMLDHPIVLSVALTTATSEIIINSPWIRSDVVDHLFKKDLEEALQRDVHISIFYGMATQKQQNRHRQKPDISKSTTAFFEHMGSKYPKLFSLKKLEGNHAKVLICDNRFMVVTSYNWLSFSGAPDSVRIETGTLIKNKPLIQEQKEQLLQKKNDIKA